MRAARKPKNNIIIKARIKICRDIARKPKNNNIIKARSKICRDIAFFFVRGE